MDHCIDLLTTAVIAEKEIQKNKSGALKNALLKTTTLPPGSQVAVPPVTPSAPPPGGMPPAATPPGSPVPAPAPRVSLPVSTSFDPAAKAALDKTYSELRMAKQQALEARTAEAAKTAELDRVVKDKDRQLAAVAARNKAEHDENIRKQQHQSQQILQQQQSANHPLKLLKNQLV